MPDRVRCKKVYLLIVSEHISQYVGGWYGRMIYSMEGRAFGAVCPHCSRVYSSFILPGMYPGVEQWGHLVILN